MKVLLSTSWKTPHTSPPLGVAYIASYLRENGIEAELLDYNVLNQEQALEKIRKSNAELFAISAMSSTFPTAVKIAEIAKKELECPVAIGGAHASIAPEDCLKKKAIDIAVIGEGELTTLELARELEKKNPNLEKVRGIHYKKGKGVKKNKPMPYIEDLDILPFPARDLIEMDKYLITPEEFPMLMPQAGLFAIRGCPFQCTYCQPTSVKMFGLKARARSPKNIVDEMELIIEEYKLGSVKMGGDTLTANRSWIMELCREIKERGIKTPWISTTRVNTVDKERLHAMKEAGCYFIQFGVESGSPRILKDVMNKGITTEQVKEAFRLCREEGIIAGANIMVGTPTETREEIEMSIKLLKEIQPDIVSGYITNPLPGTYLYDNAVEEGLITTSDLEQIDRHGVGTMKREVPDKELLLYLKKIWLTVKKEKTLNYLMPWRKPYYLKTAFKRDLNLLKYDRHTLIEDLKANALAPFALLKAERQTSKLE